MKIARETLPQIGRGGEIGLQRQGTPAIPYRLVQSPVFLAGLGAGRDVLPFASSAPPATPMLIWAVLYPLAFLGAAVAAFSRRDV